MTNFASLLITLYGRFANAHIKQNLLAPFLDVFLIKK